MNPYNDKNTTDNSKSQETNFDIVKRIHKAAYKLDLTSAAFKVLLYQLDQEFGFIRNGKVKDGDVIGHLRRSKHLGISRSTEFRAISELEKLNVITITPNRYLPNCYHINRDTSTWILSSKHESKDDTTEYTFTPYQTKELLKHCDDIETEKLWLLSMGIPQDKAFGTLIKKLSHL